MSASLAANNVYVGVMFEITSVKERKQFGASSLSLPGSNRISEDSSNVMPSASAIAVLDERVQAPLPDEILELLTSTARFVEAVLQLDCAAPTFSDQSAYYDTLASVKRSLQQIAWSRALE
jgi:hypothetical protein